MCTYVTERSGMKARAIHKDHSVHYLMLKQPSGSLLYHLLVRQFTIEENVKNKVNRFLCNSCYCFSMTLVNCPEVLLVSCC